MYHSISKESAERIEIENRINQMTQYLKKYQNKVKEFGPGFEKYFNLHYDEKSQTFILPEERCSVVERELDLAGYFCIVTSEKMSAKEAIELYKSRDVSEKLFRGDKSYLGNKSIRVYSEESARAKIFVEFVAMIVRCKMYIKLKEEMKKLDKKLNYMTVPAAIKELEKIIVFNNLTEKEVTVQMQPEWKEYHKLLGNYPGDSVNSDGEKLVLQAYETLSLEA